MGWRDIVIIRRSFASGEEGGSNKHNAGRRERRHEYSTSSMPIYAADRQQMYYTTASKRSSVHRALIGRYSLVRREESEYVRDGRRCHRTAPPWPTGRVTPPRENAAARRPVAAHQTQVIKSVAVAAATRQTQLAAGVYPPPVAAARHSLVSAHAAHGHEVGVVVFIHTRDQRFRIMPPSCHFVGVTQSLQGVGINDHQPRL